MDNKIVGLTISSEFGPQWVSHICGLLPELISALFFISAPRNRVMDNEIVKLNISSDFGSHWVSHTCGHVQGLI